MQQNDYTSAYYPPPPPPPQNPNPTTTNHHHHQPPPTQSLSSYASAPPSLSDYNYPPNPNPHLQQYSNNNPDPSSSYLPPNPNPNSTFPQFDNNNTNPSSYQSQQTSYNYPPYDQTDVSYAPHNTIHLNQYSYNNPPSVPVSNNPVPNTLPNFVPNHPVSASYDTNNYGARYGTNNMSGLGSYDANNYGASYGRTVSDLGLGLGGGGGGGGGGGVDYYGNRNEFGMSRTETRNESNVGGYGEGIYAYQGGKVEPYGSRGTDSKSSTWKEKVVFDDFGRPIGGGKDLSSSVLPPKIVKAVPKGETREDVKGGVQKFRVKMLAESGGQSTMDVLCQIGLDGIRMLDPSTNRTLRIYPLDTVTRCEVYDSSTFAFWSKSSVDIEPRRIRLQSNSYTTNTLLDTVTAATFQVKEMGGRSRPVDAVKVSDQSTEKKKGLGDWMNIIKPLNEEKDHWVPDEAVTKCTGCGSDFSAFNRKHHCRNCGDIFCDKCTHNRIALTSEDNAPQVRVCDRCMLEVTHRLSSAKEAAASRSSGLHSHEDLAKKLQEELERNHKPSSGFKSEGSSRRMKEVACPTCTVHLQVQVPSSGSETIECGVCQHPFLVSAR